MEEPKPQPPHNNAISITLVISIILGQPHEEHLPWVGAPNSTTACIPDVSSQRVE
jgi:hypothetical protein